MMIDCIINCMDHSLNVDVEILVGNLKFYLTWNIAQTPNYFAHVYVSKCQLKQAWNGCLYSVHACVSVIPGSPQ